MRNIVRKDEVLLRWAVRFNLLLPVLLVICLYGSWIVARLELGHWPRPMFDDPVHINSIVFSLLGAPAGYAIVFGLPISILTHVLSILCIISKHKSIERRLIDLEMFAILAFASLLLFLRWDPYDVFEWFLD